MAKNTIITFDANVGTVSIFNKQVIFNSIYGVLPIPTRDGYRFLGCYKNNFPSEYQEVEYIEGIGTQYIDTKVYPKSTTKVIFDFAIIVTGKVCRNCWVSSGKYYSSISINSSTIVKDKNDYTLYALWEKGNVNNYYDQY